MTPRSRSAWLASQNESRFIVEVLSKGDINDDETVMKTEGNAVADVVVSDSYRDNNCSKGG